MILPKPQRHYSLSDYLSLEEGSSLRHEFFAGEIFAMAGGTLAHNQIAANLLSEVATALKNKPCRALGSNMRLLTSGGLLTYPDAMVICGEPAFAHDRQDLVTNPVLLVEVLSPATRVYDLGEKFELYKAIASLKEYLVVEQDSVSVRAFRRHTNAWEQATFADLEDCIPLTSIEVQLALAGIYAKALAP